MLDINKSDIIKNGITVMIICIFVHNVFWAGGL